MTLTLREPTPDDATAIADLHVATWRETYARCLPDGFFTDEYAAGRRRMWEHVLRHPRDHTVVRVAECDGALIGFAWAGGADVAEGTTPPRERQLYALYVAAAHHGTGVGQALLDAALGSTPAMLWVAKENPRAISFYLRNGFVFDGAEHVDPHTPDLTAARMIR